eukprot:m.76602 g.76602  ORF g.76602 m.76602 type:complete len:104 (+) comp11889_c0_seq6:1247-1558(+)
MCAKSVLCDVLVQHCCVCARMCFLFIHLLSVFFSFSPKQPDGDELRDLLDDLDLIDKAYHVLVANEVTDFDTLKLMSKEDMLKIGLKMGVALKIIGALHDNDN